MEKAISWNNSFGFLFDKFQVSPQVNHCEEAFLPDPEIYKVSSLGIVLITVYLYSILFFALKFFESIIICIV
jgi:hypothetical protein